MVHGEGCASKVTENQISTRSNQSRSSAFSGASKQPHLPKRGYHPVPAQSHQTVRRPIPTGDRGGLTGWNRDQGRRELAAIAAERARLYLSDATVDVFPRAPTLAESVPTLTPTGASLPPMRQSGRLSEAIAPSWQRHAKRGSFLLGPSYTQRSEGQRREAGGEKTGDGTLGWTGRRRYSTLVPPPLECSAIDEHPRRCFRTIPSGSTPPGGLLGSRPRPHEREVFCEAPRSGVLGTARMLDVAGVLIRGDVQQGAAAAGVAVIAARCALVGMVPLSCALVGLVPLSWARAASVCDRGRWSAAASHP